MFGPIVSASSAAPSEASGSSLRMYRDTTSPNTCEATNPARVGMWSTLSPRVSSIVVRIRRSNSCRSTNAMAGLERLERTTARSLSWCGPSQIATNACMSRPPAPSTSPPARTAATSGAGSIGSSIAARNRSSLDPK